MLATKIKTADLKKIRLFFATNAQSCVHEAEGMLKHRFVTPSYAVKAGKDDQSGLPERSRTGHYLQMYDWDACFFSQLAPRVGVEKLAEDVIANFLALKQDNGYVPRTVSPGRIWDAGDQCKPFLCQTLLHQFQNEEKLGQRKESFALLIDQLDSYLSYFERERKGEYGLYHWRNVLESGVDDNLALLSPREAAKDEDDSVSKFPDGKLLACDLSAYLLAEFNAIAHLAKIYEKNDLALKYEKRAAELANAIETHLWNEDLSMYCNLNPQDMSQVKIRAWTGLVPALLGFAKSERFEKVLRNNICTSEHFLRPAGIASVAASEPLYNNALRGLYGRAIVSNWQGPVWVLTNGLVCRALVKNGFRKEAEDIACRMLNTLIGDLDKNGTLHENYHAETAEALWAPQFMSWNIIALEMADLLE